MLNLFDMLGQSQNGQGIELLARQFGLSQDQARQAVEALLPAFSRGLKQNASDPYGIGAFMTALASGQHAKYFEDPANAFTPEGMAEGNGILGHLFGSKELSRAVASQAAQATGIGQEVLKQMLPVLAAMIMGGMFKQSTGRMQAGGLGGGNPFGEIIGEMMRQAGGQQPRAPQPANPFDNPFGKALQDMFGGAAQQAPSEPRQDPSGGNPWGKMFEEMMRQAQAPEPRPEPERRQQANPSGRPRNPYDDLFGEMFETGRKTRDEYQKGVESVFDQFRKGMDRYR